MQVALEKCNSGRFSALRPSQNLVKRVLYSLEKVLDGRSYGSVSIAK